MATATARNAITLAVMVLGAAAYGALMAWEPPAEFPYFGTRIYDYYFLSVSEGRLDIPVRIASYEGHYDADGRAYVYHGMAPLLFRAFMAPFVDLISFPTHAVAIWSMAVIGTALYHVTFVRVLTPHLPDGPGASRALLLIGLMVWIAAPGPVLVSNSSLFHEPVAFAYMAIGGFVLVLSGMILRGKDPLACVIPITIMAAAVLHARPHLAIGLYAGAILVMLIALRRHGMRTVPRLAIGTFILFAGGLALLAMNEIRAGNALMLHGALQPDVLEHGSSYWPHGLSHPQPDAINKHGRFHPGRIAPNFLIYSAIAGPYADWLEGVWRGLIAPFGNPWHEPPFIGFVPLWLPWIVLILAAPFAARSQSRRAWVLLIATGIGALMMLSYPTVTLRYRVDLWPFFASLAVVALARQATGRGQIFSPPRQATLGLMLCFTLVALQSTVSLNKSLLREYAPFSEWSFEQCQDLARKKGFNDSRIEELCALDPPSETRG